jgi:hypothetical protein
VNGDSRRGKKKEKRHEPTEEAAQEMKEKEKGREKMTKKAMKRQKGDQKADKRVEKENKGSGGNATVSKISTSSKGLGEKTVTNKRPNRPKEVATPQGRRRVPTPGDASGCSHCGLRELIPCDKAWLKAYVKVGAWLHKKPCVDCSTRSEGSEQTRERVMDASVLVKGKGPNVAWICNCGPVGHKMKDGADGKEDYVCDMMLCLPCYGERESKMGAGGRTKRRRG